MTANGTTGGREEEVSIEDTEEITFDICGGTGHAEGVVDSMLEDGETTLTVHNWTNTIGVGVAHEADGQLLGACAHLSVDEARTLRDELDAVIGDE